MKERPILFSGPMVRALLDGSKTQTRRVMRYQPDECASVTVERFHQTVVDRYGEEQPGPEVFGAWWADGEHGCACPYGQPGDRLWVRETWMADPPITSDWPSTQFAGCRPRDHSLIPEQYRLPKHCLYRADGHDFHGWTPAIHMFHWASRITLEITGVRVERLWEISDADARAEGCEGTKLSYAKLWETINGPGSWDANPWVWVVEFKRGQP